MQIRTLILLLICGGFTACTDLELLPEDRLDPTVVYSDEANYEAALARIYSGLAVTGQQGPAGASDIQSIDEGFSNYVRVQFKLQELSTEEAVVAWRDPGLSDLIFQTWTADNPFIRAMYYRIFYQVSIANEFLRETTTERLDARGIREGFRGTVAEYRAEARFLRAYSYWHGIDMFGDVIFYTEQDAIGGTPPTVGSRSEVFDFLIEELAAIESALPAVGAAEYGRIDRGALYMLQAKLFQNARVYTGTARDGEATAALEKLIDADAYALADNYRDLFGADNNTFNEAIFTINSDGDRTQSFGALTFLTHAPVGGSMDPVAYGINGGWGGLRTTKQFVNLFPDITGQADKRAIFYTSGQSLEIENIFEFTQGYAVPKYTNITSDGVAGSDPGFADTDFPVFRLADAYLMYAESVLRGGGGDRSRALGLVNELRRRAYQGSAGDINDNEMTLGFILAERARELYWECHRRTDLIRFDAFSTSGVWAWKGGTQAGRTTDAKYNLFPIPSSEILSNPNLKNRQNTGY